ncbi:MAG: GDYXXLXY domain-containing protein [Gemmatimonadaceae bacterium]
MMRTTVFLFGGLGLVLGAVNFAIVDKERLLRNGTTMLVELAPVDPRSLLGGDYMRLDYAMARRTEVGAGYGWPRNGRMVVTLDERGVAQFARRYEGGTLAPREHLLQYRIRGNRRMRIGSDAFFFEEGTGARYTDARYGELRVDVGGESVLVGLRDGELRPLR